MALLDVLPLDRRKLAQVHEFSAVKTARLVASSSWRPAVPGRYALACMQRRFGRSGVAVTRGTVLAWLLLACAPSALALNPALDISQYGHMAWKIREGFAKGPILSIAQTPDGYLWLATEFGLYRFDGVTNVPWSPPAGQHLPSNQIWRLLVTRDGTLWIGTNSGLASWKGGRLTEYAELAGRIVGSLIEDRDGSVWASGLAVSSGRLCAIQNGSVQCMETTAGSVAACLACTRIPGEISGPVC
jgi:hypothetical protein